jgi:hypothetical protein
MNEILSRDSFPNEHHYALEKKRLETIGDYSYGRFNGHEQERLGMHDEITAYIDTWDGDYLQEVEIMHSDMDTEPLPKALSAYVIISVAAAQEAHTLANTLEQYAHQEADSSTWSLLLYLNHVTPTTPENDANIQAVERIIEEFKETYPHLSVRVARKTYENEAPPIGSIKGEAWDLALYDVMKNDVDNDDLIGIAHDADAAFISPNYISEMQRAAKENPTVDIFTGYMNWEKYGDADSKVNRIVRYWEYILNLQQVTTGELNKSFSPDLNSGIRFSTFAAARGFNKHVKLAEVHDLQRRIAAARKLGDAMSHFHYIDSISLTTNPRRLYEAINRGIPPDFAWQSMPFSTGHDPIRNADNLTLANASVSYLDELKILITADQLHLRHIEDASYLCEMGRRALGLSMSALYDNKNPLL